MWVPKLDRWATAREKLSWHGWPTHPALAGALVTGCPTLDTKLLKKPHELCGSGFALPCAASVLVSALASIQLGEATLQVARPLAMPVPGFRVHRVLQNGGCFLSALHIALAPLEDQTLWTKFVRNDVSAPLDSKTGLVHRERLLYEEQCCLMFGFCFFPCVLTCFFLVLAFIYI